MGRTKVYGGMPMLKVDGVFRQVKTVVAATSQKQAVAALASQGCSMSLYEFSKYWAESGNERALKAALAEPGMLFIQPDEFHGPYLRYSK